ncbi:MAG: hypothetical protein HQ592_15690 [Planctomycetes bacterium]|nr:hypothetical protein [Planctomycetota bacterium]
MAILRKAAAPPGFGFAAPLYRFNSALQLFDLAGSRLQEDNSGVRIKALLCETRVGFLRPGTSAEEGNGMYMACSPYVRPTAATPLQPGTYSYFSVLIKKKRYAKNFLFLRAELTLVLPESSIPRMARARLCQ